MGGAAQPAPARAQRHRSHTLTLTLGWAQRGAGDRTALTPAAQAAILDAAGGHGTPGAQLFAGSWRTPPTFSLVKEYELRLASEPSG